MTKEELLKPRYKVIGPYPEMERHNVKVGDILTEGDRFTTTRNQNGDAVFTFEWETFPNIFKKMEWWQDREPSDYPKYVKWTITDRVGQIQKFEYKRELGTIILDSWQMTAAMWLPGLIPADEHEYDDYINKP